MGAPRLFQTNRSASCTFLFFIFFSNDESRFVSYLPCSPESAKGMRGNPVI